MLDGLIAPIGFLIIALAIYVLANTIISCQDKIVDVEIKQLNYKRLKGEFNAKEKSTDSKNV